MRYQPTGSSARSAASCSGRSAPDLTDFSRKIEKLQSTGGLDATGVGQRGWPREATRTKFHVARKDNQNGEGSRWLANNKCINPRSLEFETIGWRSLLHTPTTPRPVPEDIEALFHSRKVPAVPSLCGAW